MAFSFGTGTTTGTLFRSDTVAPTPTFGTPSTSSIFGGQPTPTLFSGSAPTPTAPSLFGNTSAATSTPLFGTTAAAPTAWSAQQPIKPPPLTPEQRIQQLQLSCNRDSQNTVRFKAIFYNSINPNEAVGPVTDPDLYRQASEGNPDPTKYYPIVAYGFDDLNKRLKLQQETLKNHEKALESLKDHLNTLKQGTFDQLIQLKKAQRRQRELAQKLMELLGKIETRRLQGYPLTAGEEQLFQKLHSIKVLLEKPNGFKGRISEIVSLARLHGDNVEVDMEKTSLDNDSVQQIFDYLQQQKSGISHLLTILAKNRRDVQIMSDTFGEPSVDFAKNS